MVVEPEGSILNGGDPGPHRTEGIGLEFIPDYMEQALFDEIYTVSDDDAFRMVKEAAEKKVFSSAALLVPLYLPL